MSFTAVVSYESPSRLGPPLVYSTQSEVTVGRPDKLKVVTLGDGPASDFYYDGKTMTAFAPQEKLIAVADAPPTIDEAKGTIEMRTAARAFNQMVRRLQEQFDARGMQMASVIKIGGGNAFGSRNRDGGREKIGPLHADADDAEADAVD